MPAGNEHIIFAPQPTFGVANFVTPTVAWRVTEAVDEIGREKIDRRYSGSSRVMTRRYQGAKLPSGSHEFDCWPDYFGSWIKALGFTDITDTQQGATTAYLHAFLLSKTSVAPGMLSIQHKRGASAATNLASATLGSMTFSIESGEPVVVSCEYQAEDEAPAGGTWTDGTASPAIIATPSYPIAGTLNPFLWDDVVITVGGTISKNGSTNELEVTGGSVVADWESLEIEISQNTESPVFLGSETPGNHTMQNFDCSVSFTADVSTPDDTWYNHVRNNTTDTLHVLLDAGVEADTGFNYKLAFAFPLLHFSEGDNPPLTGENDRRTVDVTAEAFLDETLDEGIGISIIDLQTSY